MNLCFEVQQTLELNRDEQYSSDQESIIRDSSYSQDTPSCHTTVPSVAFETVPILGLIEKALSQKRKKEKKKKKGGKPSHLPQGYFLQISFKWSQCTSLTIHTKKGKKKFRKTKCCVYTHTHTHTCAHTHAHTCMHTQRYASPHPHPHTQTHMHAWTGVYSNIVQTRILVWAEEEKEFVTDV